MNWFEAYLYVRLETMMTGMAVFRPFQRGSTPFPGKKANPSKPPHSISDTEQQA
jgi:DNA-binding transcriptional regulator of glucitol operon